MIRLKFTPHILMAMILGQWEMRIWALKRGNMTLAYHTFIVPHYPKQEWRLQASENPLMIKGKYGPKDMLVE